MVLGYIIVGVLVAQGCFNGINEGLPTYIVEQNFGLVDVLYRLLKVVAPMFLLYSLLIFTRHRPSIIMGSVLYLLAFGVKKLTRHLAYKDYL